MKTSTSNRLKEVMSKNNLRQIDILNLCKPFCEKYDVRLGKNDLSQYINGKVQPKQDKLSILGMALNVSEAWLMGFDVDMKRDSEEPKSNTYPIGYNLKQLRENNHLTLAEMSKEMNISMDELKRFEDGTKEIPLQTMIKFASFFDVSIDELQGISLFNKGQTAFVSTNERQVELHRRWNEQVGELDYTDKEHDLIILVSNFIKEIRGKENYESLLDMAFMMIEQLKK